MAKYKELRLNRSGEPLLWILAAILGLGCLQLPQYLNLPDDSTRRMIGQAGLFFAGAFMGFVRPERVWRWGVASILIVPTIDFSLMVNLAVFPSPSALDALPVLLERTPQYAVLALPAVVGAYFGAHCTKV